MLSLDLAKLCRTIEEHDGLQTAGRLRSSNGVLLSCTLPAAVGDRCQVITPAGKPLLGEIIGFSGSTAFLVLYEEGAEIQPGMQVVRKGQGMTVPVGEGLLGRI